MLAAAKGRVLSSRPTLGCEGSRRPAGNGAARGSDVCLLLCISRELVGNLNPWALMRRLDPCPERCPLVPAFCLLPVSGDVSTAMLLLGSALWWKGLRACTFHPVLELWVLPPEDADGWFVLTGKDCTNS